MKVVKYCEKCFKDPTGYLKTMNDILGWNEEYTKKYDTIGFYCCEENKECCTYHPDEKLYQMQLNTSEFNTLSKISNDSNFIISMNKLKEENIIDFNLKMSQFKANSQTEDQNTNNSILHCPYCNSTNIRKIGTVNRTISVGMFGLASKKIGKTHKCNHCGSTW